MATRALRIHGPRHGGKRWLGLGLLLLAWVTLVGQGLAKPKADVDESLRRFFREVKSFEARFDQTVLDEGHQIVQESAGTLWIERPDRFRWEYELPYRQLIVGDGERIWVYDPALQQVTVRPLRGGLGDTPAVLLAGRGRLDDRFVVRVLGRQGELDWAQLIPKRPDGGFVDIRIGFENGRIRVLEMIDGFGQTTRVSLREVRENARIDPAKFRFTPPAGVDVVGE
jgi:outer membrane lipoprotein carrier protein